jgi:hypothetical protein
MKIRLGDHHHIDFDGPVKATDEQIGEIMQFFYSNFFENVIEIDEESEFRDDRLGDKLFRKEWSQPEYAELVRLNKNTEELVDGLGRSHMSIDMQRIGWMEDFFRWVRRNNIQLFTSKIEEVIDRYNENQENIKLLKKERKRKLRTLEKNLKDKEKKLERSRQIKENFSGYPGSDEGYEKALGEKVEAKQALDQFKKLIEED